MKFAKRLQPFFNMDGGAAGGGSPAPEGGAPAPVSFETPAAPTPTGPPAGMTNPLLEQPATPTPTPQEMLDFGGRKVPVVDPSLKDLHNDYTQLTQTYQQTNQQNQLLQQQVQFFQQQMQALQQQQAPAQPQQPVQPQLSPEEVAAQNQAWMDAFYENPMEAIQKVIDQAVSPKLETALQPIQQMQKEREYATQIQGLQQKFQDFNSVIPKMQELNQQNPQLADAIGLENLYWMAKGQSAQPQQPQYTPQQLMNDPQYQQQIISNPQIQQQIINQYLQNVRQQQAQTPPVMGNNVAGQAPMSPPMSPRTIAEGSKAFRSFLASQN